MNEADAAAYAQIYSAPGKRTDLDTFMYISSDVGIGASIMLEGTLFGGKHSWAGEIGHTCVDPAGPKCTCGANGCLEQYAGQVALLANAGLAQNAGMSELISVFDAGDARARATLDTAATSLGRAIANALNLLDVDVVILGGNLALLLPRIEQLLFSEVQYRQLRSRWAPTQILADVHSQNSALLGACYATVIRFIHAPTDWM